MFNVLLICLLLFAFKQLKSYHTEQSNKASAIIFEDETNHQYTIKQDNRYKREF